MDIICVCVCMYVLHKYCMSVHVHIVCMYTHIHIYVHIYMWYFSINVHYSWPLNNTGVRGADTQHSRNSCITFDSPKTFVPWCLQRMGSRTPHGYQNLRMLKPPVWNGSDQCVQSALCIHRLPTTDWKQYRYLLKKKNHWISGLA